MYYSFTVSIPSEHVVRIKHEGVVYIYYEYGRTYDKDKKYNAPKRMGIGKQVVGDETKMYPNQNYFRQFPDSAEKPEESSYERRSSALEIGSYIVIKKIIHSLGIDTIVTDMAGSGDGGLLLDFAAYSLITEDNAAQYYPDYAYHHALFTEGMRIFSDSKISSFLSDLGEEASSAFLSRWNAKMDHREKIYISYDSTNKNSQAGDLKLVEYGKPKDDKGLPIFGYSIAYDKTNSQPLFYEKYPGSIVDVSQLEFMLEKAKAYGYRNATFILDRGYFSEYNFKYMDDNGYDFIILLKGKKNVVKAAYDAKHGTFENKKGFYIKNYGVYGTTVELPVFSGDKPRYVHIYFDIGKRAGEQKKLEETFNRMSEAIDKRIGKKFEFSGKFLEYYDITYDKDGKVLFYEEKDGVREELVELCGYTCIVTSEKMTAGDALDRYKSRDESEKLFRGDKSYLGNKSMRTYTEEKTEAKILIEFIALIIRSRIYTNIHLATLNLVTKPNYSTVPAVMRELEKIEMSRGFDDVYRLDHAITKKQREILSYFGISEQDVRDEAKVISEKLRTKEV